MFLLNQYPNKVAKITYLSTYEDIGGSLVCCVPVTADEIKQQIYLTHANNFASIFNVKDYNKLKLSLFPSDSYHSMVPMNNASDTLSADCQLYISWDESKEPTPPPVQPMLVGHKRPSAEEEKKAPGLWETITKVITYTIPENEASSTKDKSSRSDLEEEKQPNVEVQRVIPIKAPPAIEQPKKKIDLTQSHKIGLKLLNMKPLAEMADVVGMATVQKVGNVEVSVVDKIGPTIKAFEAEEKYKLAFSEEIVEATALAVLEALSVARIKTIENENDTTVLVREVLKVILNSPGMPSRLNDVEIKGQHVIKHEKIIVKPDLVVYDLMRKFCLVSIEVKYGKLRDAAYQQHENQLKTYLKANPGLKCAYGIITNFRSWILTYRNAKSKGKYSLLMHKIELEGSNMGPTYSLEQLVKYMKAMFLLAYQENGFNQLVKII
eukprot:TRINITY_DN1675_c0_g1_i2.p1 TRINITY_DN1675_c0_g1~~TRINITY_DN1675_c0_g1_i2.p1  ORF type:complete len:436 (+),score=38.49 TRINITY_DN1675_c0_g1_i2:359-1666(+)